MNEKLSDQSLKILESGNEGIIPSWIGKEAVAEIKKLRDHVEELERDLLLSYYDE